MFDGTDAVMLSAETAVGHHPVEVVQVMDRIVRAAEVETGPAFVRRASPDNRRLTFEEAICLSASSAAAATGATAIVAFSERGTTARLVSKQRPAAPIIGFTRLNRSAGRWLYWGSCRTPCRRFPPPMSESTRRATPPPKADGLATAGQRIVILQAPESVSRAGRIS